jgi:hypothetical protein
MTKQAFLSAVLDQYPEWMNPEHIVKLKARGLRRLLEQAWDEGAASGKSAPQSDAANDLQERLFPWLRKK